MTCSLKDFDYNLPAELIAQSPADQRDASCLMVVDRRSGMITHKIFNQISEYFDPGDCLVLNDTKVIPARIFGVKNTGGKIEVLLLSSIEKNLWSALVKPGKRVPVGCAVKFGGGSLNGKICKHLENGGRVIEFDKDPLDFLEDIGHVPLPPYIKRDDRNQNIFDKERYQTVYASNPGAVAAPTAGLHFTNDLLDNLSKKGVKIAKITLHVGYGTFKPVEVDDVSRHKMHKESYSIPEKSAEIINQTKKNGGTVFVAGTTAVRALETAAGTDGILKSGEGQTDIFIYPPFQFKISGRIITNFHLPKSTLLMMISAFAGRDLLFKAYNEAVAQRYRFYSYGDAMLIL